MSAIHKSAIAGDTRRIEQLLLQGADLDVRLLIDRQADVSPDIPNGYTLLTLAACADRMDVFELLLSHGARIDGQSSHGESGPLRLERVAGGATVLFFILWREQAGLEP